MIEDAIFIATTLAPTLMLLALLAAAIESPEFFLLLLISPFRLLAWACKQLAGLAVLGMYRFTCWESKFREKQRSILCESANSRDDAELRALKDFLNRRRFR